jgi:hypothetical protein
LFGKFAHERLRVEFIRQRRESRNDRAWPARNRKWPRRDRLANRCASARSQRGAPRDRLAAERSFWILCSG